MAALAGLPRQIFKHRRREIDHLDLVERARRERKQRPADAVALGVLFLPDIAERHHGLGEMKRRGIVQADEPAQIGKPDPVAMPRHRFENAESAAERLDADALPVLDVLVGGPGRRDQPGGFRPGGAMLQAFDFGGGFDAWCRTWHSSGPSKGRRRLYHNIN